MPSDLATRFHSLRSSAPFWSLRYHDERREVLAMRQDTIEPPSLSFDRGAMLTAVVEGGYGYCATSDLSGGGLQQALDRATRWAEATRGTATSAAAPVARRRTSLREEVIPKYTIEIALSVVRSSSWAPFLSST